MAPDLGLIGMETAWKVEAGLYQEFEVWSWFWESSLVGPTSHIGPISNQEQMWHHARGETT